MKKDFNFNVNHHRPSITVQWIFFASFHLIFIGNYRNSI